MTKRVIKQELLETGETLYCCPQCPFKAEKMQTTKVHMARHSGQFVCLKCRKSCRSKKDLNSHMKNVHKEEPTVDNDEPQQLVMSVNMAQNEVTASVDQSRQRKRRKKKEPIVDNNEPQQLEMNMQMEQNEVTASVAESRQVKRRKKKEPIVNNDQPQQLVLNVKMEQNEVTASVDRSRLGKRRKKEANKGQYKCQYCDYTADRKILLNQHCKYHMNSSVIKHLCPACYKPFPSPYHVKRHIHYNHPDTNYSLIKLEPKKEATKESAPINMITVKSPLKKKRRTKKTSIVQETPEKEEPEQKNSLNTTVLPPTTIVTPPPEDSFQCAHCTYSTKHKNHLRQHMTYHSSKYLCNICEKSFPCARRLQLHIDRIHTEDSTEVKSEPDTSEETNDTNKENETNGEVQVKNEITSSLWGFDLSDFGIDAIVLNDETISEDVSESPTTSNVLPTFSSNVFPNEFNVQTEATNDAENPFSCPFCPYRGKKKRNLDSHMVYHTDKFKCETCSKRHPTLYHLNRHIRLVHCGNPDETFPKQEQDDEQSSPSLYLSQSSNADMKDESSECSLPFNLTDLMAVEATEDLNGTIKLEPDSDCELPNDCDDDGLLNQSADQPLNPLNDILTLPHDILFSVETDGQKLYFCADCSYKNPKKQNVKQHRKIHTSLYACPSCGKGHTTSFHLKRHLNHGNCNVDKPSGKDTSVPRKRSKKANGQA